MAGIPLMEILDFLISAVIVIVVFLMGILQGTRMVEKDFNKRIRQMERSMQKTLESLRRHYEKPDEPSDPSDTSPTDVPYRKNR